MADTTVAEVNRDRGAAVWHIGQIYTEEGQTNRIVPNPNDVVIDPTAMVSYTVTDVDYSTGLSTLTVWTAVSETGQTDYDVLVGTVGTAQTESYVVYIDETVVPRTLVFDSRLRVYPKEAQYIKLFKETDISDASGTVISVRYDSSGNIIDNNIQLEAVEVEDGVTTIASPVSANALESISDGGTVTAVVYGSSGKVLSICRLLVYNTSLVMSSSTSEKTIVSIDLLSSFFSDSDTTIIDVPVNMPVDSLTFMVQITYNTGGTVSTRTVNVSSSNVSLYGLDTFVASSPGQVENLVLVYTLASDETAVNANGVSVKTVSKTYKLRCVEADGAYSVKLFVLPEWDASTSSYTLHYFLYNLDRLTSYDATDYVTMNTGSAAFKPSTYGVEQSLSVVVNLEDVDGSFNSWRHVQNFKITLIQRPTDDSAGDCWSIEYSDSTGTTTGPGLNAIATFQDVGDWSWDITCGCTSYEDWLDKLYYAIQPLYYTATESGPPTPTDFKLIYGSDVEEELSISNWDESIAATTGGVANGSLLIEWYKTTETSKLYLGATSLVIRQVVT